MSDKREIVLDVDVGIDDALMMLYIAAQPNTEIVAVGSAHGNCSAAQAAINARKVLDVLGLDQVPVAVGAESPIPGAVHSPHVHGHDGLADVNLPEPSRGPSGEHAVDQLIRLSKERPGELDLMAVAAMTNLGLALERDPEVLNRFRSVALLCAISSEPGPEAPELYDANVFHSPDAADKLFASGADMLVCPIDLSYQAVLEDEHIEAIRSSSSPVAQFAWKILPYYMTFYQQRLGRWSACMHDPIAAAIELDPTLITAQATRPMYVEPYLERYRAVGRDVPPRPEVAGRAPVRIATAADIPRFLDGFVTALTGNGIA